MTPQNGTRGIDSAKLPALLLDKAER